MRQTTPHEAIRIAFSESDAARRTRKLRPIEAKFFAGPPNHASIQRFMRAAQGHLGLSIVAMNRHRDLTVMTLFMFMPIEPASLLGEPFPKCCAFHSVLRQTLSAASCHAHTEQTAAKCSPYITFCNGRNIAWTSSLRLRKIKTGGRQHG